MKITTIFKEQDGMWSSRRVLAFISFINAVFLSWKNVDWRIIMIFSCLTLILLGLTTVSDIALLGGLKDRGNHEWKV